MRGAESWVIEYDDVSFSDWFGCTEYCGADDYVEGNTDSDTV